MKNSTFSRATGVLVAGNAEVFSDRARPVENRRSFGYEDKAGKAFSPFPELTEKQLYTRKRCFLPCQNENGTNYLVNSQGKLRTRHEP